MGWRPPPPPLRGQWMMLGPAVMAERIPAVLAAIEADPWEAWILYGPNDGSTMQDWLAAQRDDTVSEERIAEIREEWRRRYA